MFLYFKKFKKFFRAIQLLHNKQINKATQNRNTIRFSINNFNFNDKNRTAQKSIRLKDI